MWRRQHGVSRKRDLFILHCTYILNYQHLKHIHIHIYVNMDYKLKFASDRERDSESYSSSYHTIVWMVYYLGIFSYPLNIVAVGSALNRLFRQHLQYNSGSNITYTACLLYPLCLSLHLKKKELFADNCFSLHELWMKRKWKMSRLLGQRQYEWSAKKSPSLHWESYPETHCLAAATSHVKVIIQS